MDKKTYMTFSDILRLWEAGYIDRFPRFPKFLEYLEKKGAI